jgi:hypothetical protein
LDFVGKGLHKNLQDCRRSDECADGFLLPDDRGHAAQRQRRSRGATHEFDDKPPTELYKVFQDARRRDERRFIKELLPQLGLEPLIDGTRQA